MRFLAVLFFCVCIPAFGHCQVVLSSGDYPATLTGVDTQHVTTAASLFPAFSTSTPGLWDMTLASDSATAMIKAYTTSSTTFGTSQPLRIGSYETMAQSNFLINSSGLNLIDLDVDSARFDLFPVTAGGADTFYILGQTALYSSPIADITFPASSSSSWSSSGFIDIAFELSVATFFYLHEPGYLRTYTNKNNVVTNWGKMRVRDMSGAPSPYIDVLQVQTSTITTDSAFLSGGPMPGHIQLLLGITQGKSDTVYSQSYYRKGEVTPLAYVEFTDATFSHAIRAKTHVQRLTNSASDPKSILPVSLYPNPASDVIEVDAAAGIFTGYEIKDMAGKSVQHGNIRLSTHPHIAINATLGNGLYQLHLITASGQTSTTTFQVQRAQ
ncbi:MAG: T9SS type A sorting domain-containing protein [Taibaiella sp.]|nr:T9SS type A sorting domain-containing protein [Taibaiella sp.]